MIALPRHGTLAREEDGASEFWRLKEEFKSVFPNSADERRGLFQLCTDNTWSEILYFRAIQGNSGENSVNPSLLDNVLSPDNFFEFVHHVGSVLNMHSISASGLIARGKNHGRYRQTVSLQTWIP